LTVPPRTAFVTGATGYLGTRLSSALLSRGWAVRALHRPGSERRLPPGCQPVSGDALRAETFAGAVAPARTLVHLVGVAHPSPARAAEFLSVDLASVRAAVEAARTAGVEHLVYVSVAHPAPAMRAYVEARQLGEELVRGAGLAATILRPWYVLGPGHRWPLLLLPAYRLLEAIPATRAAARRLHPITLAQMIAGLLEAVEHPPRGLRVVEVPELRAHSAAPVAGGQPRVRRQGTDGRRRRRVLES
jgi:uncharacterized protein YbjT (DUF2867 family)